MMYCTVCDWTSGSDCDRAERGRRAIDHHIETGHRIESADSTESTEARGRWRTANAP